MAKLSLKRKASDSPFKEAVKKVKDGAVAKPVAKKKIVVKLQKAEPPTKEASKVQSSDDDDVQSHNSSSEGGVLPVAAINSPKKQRKQFAPMPIHTSIVKEIKKAVEEFVKTHPKHNIRDYTRVVTEAWKEAKDKTRGEVRAGSGFHQLLSAKMEELKADVPRVQERLSLAAKLAAEQWNAGKVQKNV